MENNTVRVERIEEAALLLPGTGLVKHVRLYYYVGDHGPFSLDMKAADYSARVARERMEAFAAELRATLP